MERSTYRERWTGRPLLLAIGGAFLVIVAVLAVTDSGDRSLPPVVPLVVIGAALLVTLLWQPHTIQLDDEGVTFIAVARRVTLPWEDLTEVRSPWFDLTRATLRWHRRSGGRITTSGRFVDVGQLILQVERCAPNVTIRGVRLPESG
jgi:hypothetical protein